MIRGLRSTLFSLILASSATLGAQEAEMDKVAARLAVKIATLPDATVAVVDFTDLQGRVTELGRYYAEELSIALVNAPGGFKVIDRGHLKALLAEHKFQTSGVVDEKTAAELGRIAGVNILITGTVTDIEGSPRLAVKALNTKSAAIQAAVSVSLLKSDTTSALLRRDISQSETGSGSLSGSGAQRQPSGAPNVRMFQNDFLIVGVESVSVRREKRGAYAYLSLTLENKSGTDLLVASNRGRTDDTYPSMMDTLGRGWKWRQITGLQRTWADSSAPAVLSRFVRLAPGARQTVLLSFTVDGASAELTGPSTASFAFEMLRYKESAPSKSEAFSVGLSGIPMGK